MYALVRFSHDNLPCIEPQDVRYVKVFDTFAEANSEMRDDLRAVDVEYGDRLGQYEAPGAEDDWAGVQIDPEVSGDVYEIQWIIREIES